ARIRQLVQRLLSGRGDREHAIERGDLEDAPRARLREDEPGAATGVDDLVDGLDDEPERGRVHERDGAEVHDEPTIAVCLRSSERASERRSGERIELPVGGHDDRARRTLYSDAL